MQNIFQPIAQRMQNTTDEFERIFHGRGGCYENFEHITLDSIGTVLYLVFFSQKDDEAQIIKTIQSFMNKHTTLVVQRRYISGSPSELICGELSEKIYALENGLKYQLNLEKNHNSGFFADMKRGREFVAQCAKGKKVLNLFAYTCAFSVVAVDAGALSVVNVDMAKNALTIGRQNHHINNLDTRDVRFMPLNILKSWSRIKKFGPYDLIILDPPSFQKGSFAASSDYVKLIKRLSELASSRCTVLSALNSPELKEEFILTLFKEYAPQFHFIKRLQNLESFCSKDEQRSLKNMLFKNWL